MDIKILETGNGGDLEKKTKDLSLVYGLENMPYLALFGGNVEASTPIKRNEGEQAFDFWANTLLMSNNPGIQFNSFTERVLNNTPLTSAGRILIEQAVKKDLEFMKKFAEVTVSVTIPATDKLEIGIKLLEPTNRQRREFIFIWDATRMELETEVAARARTIPVSIGFDYTLDFNID